MFRNKKFEQKKKRESSMSINVIIVTEYNATKPKKMCLGVIFSSLCPMVNLLNLNFRVVPVKVPVERYLDVLPKSIASQPL